MKVLQSQTEHFRTSPLHIVTESLASTELKSKEEVSIHQMEVQSAGRNEKDDGSSMQPETVTSSCVSKQELNWKVSSAADQRQKIGGRKMLTREGSISAIYDFIQFLRQEQKKPKKKKREVKDDIDKWPGKGLALPDDTQVKKPSPGEHVLKEFVRGLLRGSVMGFLLKGVLNGLVGLMKRKSAHKVLQMVFSVDTKSFTKFLGGFCAVFRAVNAWLSQRDGVESPRNAAIAGAIASTTVLFDVKSRRKDISLYLFVRAMDVFCKQKVRTKQIPNIKFLEEFLFGLCNIPIMYGFLFEPELLEPGYYKWICGMGNISDDTLTKVFREVRNARLNDGIILPYRECNLHNHEGTCKEFIIKDFFQGLLRAARVYLPVHLIPLIVFKMKHLRTEPVETIQHTLYGFLASCTFLSAYVTCIRVTSCGYRNAFKAEHASIAVISAMLTPFATFFERKSRVNELMIYCWPRSLEASFNYLHKYHNFPTVKYWDVPVFMIAMSILMSSSKQDFKPTFHNLFCKIIGSS